MTTLAEKEKGMGLNVFPVFFLEKNALFTLKATKVLKTRNIFCRKLNQEFGNGFVVFSNQVFGLFFTFIFKSRFLYSDVIVTAKNAQKLGLRKTTIPFCDF